MVTFLSFDKQNLIMVNNEVTTIATQCYRFCDFVILVFPLLSYLNGLATNEKKTIIFFLWHEATRSTPRDETLVYREVTSKQFHQSSLTIRH